LNDNVVIFDVPDASRHRCDDCGSIVLGRRLLPIVDIEQRLEPGSVVPSGECPHCRALCYPMKPVEGKKPKRGKAQKKKSR